MGLATRCGARFTGGAPLLQAFENYTAPLGVGFICGGDHYAPNPAYRQSLTNVRTTANCAPDLPMIACSLSSVIPMRGLTSCEGCTKPVGRILLLEGTLPRADRCLYACLVLCNPIPCPNNFLKATATHVGYVNFRLGSHRFGCFELTSFRQARTRSVRSQPLILFIFDVLLN